MSKNELKKLIKAGLSQRKIAAEKKCSQSTVKYWLAKYGLNTKIAKFNKKKTFKCADCGEADKDKFLVLKKRGRKPMLHHTRCKKLVF